MRSSVRRAIGAGAATLALAACNSGNSPAGDDTPAEARAPAVTAQQPTAAAPKAAASGADTADAATRADATLGEGATTGADAATLASTANVADARAAAVALGVPLYPGASVKSSIVGSSDGSRGAMVTLETAALPAEVIGFYRERLESSGHAIKAEVNAGAIRMLGAEQANRSLTIQVTAKPGGGSTIALMGSAR